MNSDLLERFIRQGRLKVVGPDGRETTYGDGTPRAAWRLNQPDAWRAIVRNPQLNLGETYMDGGWDVTQGSLHDLLTILRRNIETNLGDSHWLNPVWSLLSSWNNIAASRRNVSHHYDLDEALFRACLDADMHYSCAYFPQPGTSLEEAQAAKCRHIAAKLDLSAGQRVLDIGSGWGSLAMHLAEHHDVTVTGLTLSAEQLRVAQERAQQRGLGNQVAFALQDYRQHNGEYDRVVSVGMFEHVGKRFYNTFFNKVAGFLTKNGVALLHTIGSKAPPTPVNPWIRRHIFPGGYIPSLSDIAPAVERSGLVTADLEVLRGHYAQTLKAWNERFQRRRSAFAQSKGERFCRMWEFYLVASQTAFEAASLVVFQWLLGKHNDAVPRTRDYLYPVAQQG